MQGEHIRPGPLEQDAQDTAWRPRRRKPLAHDVGGALACALESVAASIASICRRSATCALRDQLGDLLLDLERHAGSITCAWLASTTRRSRRSTSAASAHPRPDRAVVRGLADGIEQLACGMFGAVEEAAIVHRRTQHWPLQAAQYGATRAGGAKLLAEVLEQHGRELYRVALLERELGRRRTGGPAAVELVEQFVA